jgi:hypothetical protein
MHHAWIGAAFWFTSTRSYANPANTAARALSDTFARIAPSGVPEFVLAHLLGGVTAIPPPACCSPTRVPNAHPGFSRALTEAG